MRFLEDQEAEVARPARFAWIAAWIALAAALGLAAVPARADAPTGDRAAGAAAIRLAAVVPADDARNDARNAVVIGAGGEVYAPDGKGAWVHRLPCTTAAPIAAAGRAADQIVAIADGVVYRLAANGWSAMRLAQHGKAVLGAGTPAVAAVGRQLFALDALGTLGAPDAVGAREPARLAVAPAAVIAIGAGAGAIAVATDAGVFRMARSARGAGKPIALPAVPAQLRLVSDRWAIVDGAALDLVSGARTAWPADLAIGPAAAAPGEALVAIGAGAAGLELVTLSRGKLVREPLGLASSGAAAVGVVLDRAGRAVVALSDGRIALRSATGWQTTLARDEPLAPRPGAPPASQ